MAIRMKVKFYDFAQHLGKTSEMQISVHILSITSNAPSLQGINRNSIAF